MSTVVLKADQVKSRRVTKCSHHCWWLPTVNADCVLSYHVLSKAAGFVIQSMIRVPNILEHMQMKAGSHKKLSHCRDVTVQSEFGIIHRFSHWLELMSLQLGNVLMLPQIDQLANRAALSWEPSAFCMGLKRLCRWVASLAWSDSQVFVQAPGIRL